MILRKIPLKNNIPSGKAPSGKAPSGILPGGNWEDKYNTKNPIARYLMYNFIKTIKQIIIQYKESIDSITEVGCGEGYLINEIYSIVPHLTIKACDFSEDIIRFAKGKFPLLDFYVKSIYHIGEEDSADLILCCEVLEHLEFPEKALKIISSVTRKYCLLSVPHEPLWRFLNMARGKYILNFGNTPGHIQHWTPHQFIHLINTFMEIVLVKSVLPWTVVFCKKK